MTTNAIAAAPPGANPTRRCQPGAAFVARGTGGDTSGS